MATFTTQPFHELLDSDKTTPSTVLDSDGKLKQSLHNVFPSTDATDTNYWTQQNVTVTESGTSPSGKAAYLLTEGSNVGASFRLYDAISVTSGRYYALSVDVKRGSGSREVALEFGSGGFGANVRWLLDFDTGDVSSLINGTKDAAIATELTDGWWNFTLYAEATSTTSPAFNVILVDGTSVSYNGDGTSSIYVSRPRVYEASVHAPVERFENTDFATDTIWGKSNWTIGSGVASKTVGSFGGLSQAIDLVAGEKYRMEVTVSNYVAGILTARLSSGSGLGADVVASENITANGTYVFILTALSSSTYAGFAGESTFDGDIDDVSITKVITDGIQNDLDGEDFIETSGSAIYHGALQYNGDGSFRGIQSFEGRTNLLLRSGEISGTSWATSWGNGVTATLNSIVSPSGQLDATKLDTTDGAGDGSQQSISSLTLDDYYTVSVFVKNDDANRTDVIVYLNSANEGVQVNWSGSDISSVQTTGSNASNARYEDYGDGWYRVSATVQAKGTSGNFVIIPENDGSNSNGSAYFWGAQLEAGSSVSPYIPTDGSTRTRVKDSLHKPLSEFGYNHDELTVKVEFESAGTDGTDFPRALQLGAIDNTTNTERHDIIYSDTGALVAVNRVNNITVSYLNLGTGPTNQLVKVMAAFKKDDYAASDDGDTVVTDTSGDMATVETLFLGNQRIFDNHLNGYIKKLIIWPKRLADATLEAESE